MFMASNNVTLNMVKYMQWLKLFVLFNVECEVKIFEILNGKLLHYNSTIHLAFYWFTITFMSVHFYFYLFFIFLEAYHVRCNRGRSVATPNSRDSFWRLPRPGSEISVKITLKSYMDMAVVMSLARDLRMLLSLFLIFFRTCLFWMVSMN